LRMFVEKNGYKTDTILTLDSSFHSTLRASPRCSPFNLGPIGWCFWELPDRCLIALL